MKKVFQTFNSFEEAEEADKQFYQSLTDQERLDLAVELMRPYYEDNPRMERIFRTAELGECPVSSDWGMGVQ